MLGTGICWARDFVPWGGGVLRAGGLNGDGGVAPVNTEAIRGTTPAKKAKALAETLISPPRCPWSYLRRLAYPQGRLLVLP